jgi:hypothetical protein
MLCGSAAAAVTPLSARRKLRRSVVVIGILASLSSGGTAAMLGRLNYGDATKPLWFDDDSEFFDRGSHLPRTKAVPARFESAGFPKGSE